MEFNKEIAAVRVRETIYTKQGWYARLLDDSGGILRAYGPFKSEKTALSWVSNLSLPWSINSTQQDDL